MSKQVELGQAVFGNPTGYYGTEDYADALIEALLSETERVFWNVNQRKWDRDEDPKIAGMEYRPYDWSDNPETTALPNLKFEHSDQEIRWYKYPHRGQSCTLDWNEKEWRVWFDKAMEIIRNGDKKLPWEEDPN